MAGFPPLLEKIAVLTQNSYGRKVNPTTDILITAGATEGIFASIQALVNPGDEVIILDPSYDCYETPILLCNAIPKRIHLNDDFSPNWELIGATMNAKTRMIITNNPHNPTGRIWNENDFVQLENYWICIRMLSSFLMKFMNTSLLKTNIFQYIKEWN